MKAICLNSQKLLEGWDWNPQRCAAGTKGKSPSTKAVCSCHSPCLPCPRLVGKPPRAAAICSSMMASGTLPKTTQGTTDIWKLFRWTWCCFVKTNNMPQIDLWDLLLAKPWFLLGTVRPALVMKRQVFLAPSARSLLSCHNSRAERVKKETMCNAKTWWPNSLTTGCFHLFDYAFRYILWALSYIHPSFPHCCQEIEDT